MKAFKPSDLLERQLAALPDAPGVYFLKDASGQTLYIGKAQSLRLRVRSYWSANSWRERPKLAHMVPRVAAIETIITNSETEALILESTLVRQHMPRYNVTLKDDKRYPWLAITYGESFPRLVMVRDPLKLHSQMPLSRVFGPYVEAGAMWETVKMLRKVFPMRQRRTPLFKDRPCMNFHIGLCLGPCQKLVEEDFYNRMVKQVELFLSGHQSQVVRQLKQEMNAASRLLNYEQAAKIRNQLFALAKIIEKQQIFFDDIKISYDVLAEAHCQKLICICLLRIREGKLVSLDNFVFPLVDWRELKAAGHIDSSDQSHVLISSPKPGQQTALASSAAEAFQAFTDRYYAGCQDGNIAREVVLDQKLDDMEALADLLSSRAGKKVLVVVGQRQKKLSLIAMAKKNARQFLDKQAAQTIEEEKKAEPLLSKLKEELSLSRLPRHIECFDISNIQGQDNVASLVVFKNGGPEKSAYRHFKVKTVEGQANDFASMEEVVFRRYRRLLDEGKSLPDLIIIDGGKGQLNAAVSALSALGLGQMDIVGLAKKQEEVYLPGQSRGVLLPRRSESLFLLQRARDEAHRFAVSFHRKLRARRAVRSKLDMLPGIGPERRKILLDHFGSFEKLASSSVEELKTVRGIPANIAVAIYNSLHAEENS